MAEEKCAFWCHGFGPQGQTDVYVSDAYSDAMTRVQGGGKAKELTSNQHWCSGKRAGVSFTVCIGVSHLCL